MHKELTAKGKATRKRIIEGAAAVLREKVGHVPVPGVPDVPNVPGTTSAASGRCHE